MAIPFHDSFDRGVTQLERGLFVDELRQPDPHPDPSLVERPAEDLERGATVDAKVARATTDLRCPERDLCSFLQSRCRACERAARSAAGAKSEPIDGESDGSHEDYERLHIKAAAGSS